MNIDDLESELDGADYQTYIDASIQIVISPEGDRTGLLIGPMDSAPMVVEIGTPEQLKSLGQYLIDAANHLEEC